MLTVAAIWAILSKLAAASIENPSLDEYYHLGRYFMDTGQYEAAAINYEAMISKHPDAGQAGRGWLGIAECRRRLMLAAMDELEKAKAKGSAGKREAEEAESRVSSNLNGALAACGKAMQQFPAQRAEAIILMGRLYADSGPEKADRALAEFKRVVEGYPEEAGRAQLFIGDLHAAIGDAKEAKESYALASLSFPEVASLAMLKHAELLYGEGEYAAAADDCTTIVDSLGVDGAYTDSYHLMGGVMEEAVKRRGAAERALGKEDDETSGYRSAAARYYGASVSMAAKLDLAGALLHYGKGEEAEALLNGIAKDYRKSVWAVKALMKLAELKGVSPGAAETYARIIRSYPMSLFRIEAQMKQAATYLALSEKEEDADKKLELRADAKKACEAVLADFPRCPEGRQAREFIERNGL